MTEHKFILGQQVVIKTCRAGIRSHEGNRGEIIQDWHDGDFTIRREDGCFCVASKIELIEPAAPRRYTGELRDGMKVWIVGVDYLDIEGREHVIRKVENEWRAYDSNDDHWTLVPKCNGEWWSNDSAAYISYVISEPEEKEEQPEKEHGEEYGYLRFMERFADLLKPYTMRIGADGFAVPVPIMEHCGCKISFKNSPHKGGIQKFMEGLKSIPAKIKRILNQNYRAFYQLGWVDEELDLTEEGEGALLDMLMDKHEDELGALAKKEVARRKKHSVQDEE